MVRRLLLGSDGAGEAIADEVTAWGGTLAAVVPDERRAAALRDEGVDARVGDPADPSTYPKRVDVAFVAVPTDAVGPTVEAARAAFPDARVVVRLGTDADAATRRSVERTADRVVDATGCLAGAVLDACVGEAADRLYRLRRVLREAEGPMAVVTHDNPDPDAIGSALALVDLARDVGLDAEACYFGEISHQENRALVNLLDVDLRRLDPDEDPAEFGSVALVDHSRPGINDGLPEDTPVDVVLDHHPPRGPVEARYVDLRTEAGATSAMLASYLEGYGMDPGARVATALLYGIRVDTSDFTREVSTGDYEAAAFLVEYADPDLLSQVESPSVSAEVMETLARAIRNRERRGDALVTGVGEITDRDALAQAADRLVDMEDVRIAVVHGIVEGTVYVSGRTRGSDVDLGETLRDAFGPIGSAGGHANMAGAQIPLGILAEVEEGASESLADVVADLLARRFFETLEDVPVRTAEPAQSKFDFEFPFEDD